MGRIRKFTQEAYDALQSGVSDDGEILDFFSDIPLNISNFFNSLELEDDLSNFQSYLRDISDFENYTAKKIDDIFRDVINVDKTYATIFRDFNDRMTDFDTIINKLKESISDVNFENNFSKDGFINSLPKETENIIGVNWKNILDKDADDISDEEYNMIAEYIIKNGDADILEEILVDCYTIKKPKNGERNPVVFDNGIEGKTEKYWYSLNKKYNGLSAAINRVTQIWIAIGYTSESDERNRWISTAAQYNTFFKEFGKNKDLVMVREIKLDGTIKELNSNLIDIKNKTGISIVFISHDLGAVAKIADRVAVMYAGKIVEIGTAEDIYYSPEHPYTWGLLSSLPALAIESGELYSIPGTPPILIDPPKGDAFAVRNEYALAIDYEKEPPMFKISDTHYAATWLLDERAPKVQRPIQLERGKGIWKKIT